MPWVSNRAAHCYTCGREREPGELFSRRGRCDDCGDGRMLENRRELRAHDGPFFQHWRRSCAAAFGAILMDDLEAEE